MSQKIQRYPKFHTTATPGIPPTYSAPHSHEILHPLKPFCHSPHAPEHVESIARAIQKYLFIYTVVKQSTGQSILRGPLESRAGPRGYLSTFILFPGQTNPPERTKGRGTRTADINEADTRGCSPSSRPNSG